MSMMRSLTGGSAGLPDAFGQTSSRFGKSFSVPGEPLLANLLGDCAPKAIAAKFGRENYHKRSENIGDNAREEWAVAWVDPTACPTEIQQKYTCLRIPAQSRNSFPRRRRRERNPVAKLSCLSWNWRGSSSVKI